MTKTKPSAPAAPITAPQLDAALTTLGWDHARCGREFDKSETWMRRMRLGLPVEKPVAVNQIIATWAVAMADKVAARRAEIARLESEIDAIMAADPPPKPETPRWHGGPVSREEQQRRALEQARAEAATRTRQDAALKTKPGRKRKAT